METPHKCMQITHFIREWKRKNVNNYKNYHNNFALSVCGWTAGNKIIIWRFMHFLQFGRFHMIFVVMIFATTVMKTPHDALQRH